MKNIMNSYFVKTHKLEISITIIAIVLFMIYFIGAPNVFTRFPIYRAFMQSMPFFGIIAISATFVVTLGEIDLSFPSIVGITSLTFGMVLTGTDGNFFISFIAATSLGMFAGLMNGLLVTKIGIPSIVATIGTLFFWRGLVNVVSQGSGIAIVDVADQTWHHALFVEKVFGKIPAQFIWFIVLTALMQWVYRYHKFGNHIHFVGDNKASSQMMGINVDNVKIIAFVQLGFFSAVAGIFTMYEMLYFWPTQGSGLMLTTLAAVFVGGTSVFGGKGTIFGTFIGVLNNWIFGVWNHCIRFIRILCSVYKWINDYFCSNNLCFDSKKTILIMNGRLQDKIAIITGAGAGIGEATAKKFVQEGAKVIIAEINSENGIKVADEINNNGGKAYFIETDVTSSSSVKSMVEKTVSIFGSPEILINNAGIVVFDDPLKLSDEDWKKCFSVDLDGVWYGCQHTFLICWIKKKEVLLI